jgi:hypothetical protein
MPRTFGTNALNDLYIGDNGKMVILTGLKAVLQTCEQVAKGFLGEMVLDIDRGVPYKQVIFVGVPNYAQFSSALRLLWLGVDGVQEVVSLVLLPLVGNTLPYTAVIRTIYGQGDISNGD